SHYLFSWHASFLAFSRHTWSFFAKIYFSRMLLKWKQKNSIPTDVFIDEIEKRPTIWDMHSKLYSNKTAKKSA
ncbi:unnamed protein product, partial [Callosobruchus maculatus]